MQSLQRAWNANLFSWDAGEDETSVAAPARSKATSVALARRVATHIPKLCTRRQRFAREVLVTSTMRSTVQNGTGSHPLNSAARPAPVLCSIIVIGNRNVPVHL